jgi:hypothetical protein
MSAFNYLLVDMICPRCGISSPQEIEMFFGSADLHEYNLSQRVHWGVAGGPDRGGRPKNGTMIGDGYSVCPVCNKDFHVKIHVYADVLESVEVNKDRMPYIA